MPVICDRHDASEQAKSGLQLISMYRLDIIASLASSVSGMNDRRALMPGFLAVLCILFDTSLCLYGLPWARVFSGMFMSNQIGIVLVGGP